MALGLVHGGKDSYVVQINVQTVLACLADHEQLLMITGTGASRKLHVVTDVRLTRMENR